MLTDKQIKALKGTGKPYRVLDGNNLYLWVNAKGTAKSWQYRYRRPTDNKADIYTIGQYPQIGLREAREEAIKLSNYISRGIDPKEQKKQEEQAKEQQHTQELTFGDVATEWLESKKEGISKKQYIKLNGALTNHITPIIGRLAIDGGISNAMLISLITIIRGKGAKTVHTLAQGVIKQVYDYAILKEYTAFSPSIKALSQRIISGEHIEKNHPHISIKDLPKLLEGLETIRSGYIVLIALKLIILIYPRQGELRQCKWDYLDWENKTLTIPSELMKGRQVYKQAGLLEHVIPLPTQAIALFKKLYDLTGNHPQGFMFPSQVGEGKVMSDGTLNKALRQIIPSDKQNIHGFRHLATTWLNEQHPELSDVIDKMLSHQERDKVKRTYNQSKHIEPMRRLYQEWGDFLTSQGLKI